MKGSKTALLHIGTPKTGTTSIQHTLARARASGDIGQVCYPLLQGQENQNFLDAVYWPFDEWSPWMRHHYSAHPRQAARLREHYRSFILSELSSARGAILSAEGLCMFSRALVAELRKDLESLGFGEFHVILYVRDPADYYLSVTQQYLRDPAKPPLVQSPLSFRYPFREMAETWEEAFPGRLEVHRFPTDPHHNVIDDFTAVLERCLDVSPPKVDVRLNATLSAEAMQILQDYREAFGLNDGSLTADVEQLFRRLRAQELPQTRPTLKPAVAEAIRANHRADGEAIYSRYGVDLELHGHSQGAALPSRPSYRVEDIISAVDPAIVHQLLLRLAKAEPGQLPAKSPLPLRIARRAYRGIPPALRPERLVARLRPLS